MRIRIDYTTAYDYALPASNVVQLLRVQPHAHEDLHVLAWRVDVDADGSLQLGTDVFGNWTHTFYAEHPITKLTLKVAGEVETVDTGGVIRGANEPLPPVLYLRTTGLSLPDPAIREFAENFAGKDRLESLHAMLSGVHDHMTYQVGETGTGTDSATAFGQGLGVCQDYTHIFCAGARHLGIPARYVSGHFVNHETQGAGHAWAEAWVDDLGWVGFDPTHGISTTAAHVRVAVGLDYLDAAPVRGARRGGGVETMRVSVNAFDSGATYGGGQQQQ